MTVLLALSKDVAACRRGTLGSVMVRTGELSRNNRTVSTVAAHIGICVSGHHLQVDCSVVYCAHG